MLLTNKELSIYYKKHATSDQKHTLNILATIVYSLVRSITLGGEAPGNSADAVRKYFHRKFYKGRELCLLIEKN